ncbi:hypothetical protein P43SY_002639 [Pythium insidiosum]|uniref:Cyclic nucleotide-binding domain-containing protein n=1 Tax=Pythium insidiosum TaxID=114742 RepID=A0AAD5QB17_PYTIN|nr:hypothetical protein P43SY_002639 [Pythium insidiosum]
MIVIAQVVILIVAVLIEHSLAQSPKVQHNPYIPDDIKNADTVDHVWLFLTYMLLFSNFVPIALQRELTADEPEASVPSSPSITSSDDKDVSLNVNELISELERGLTLIGISGVEDKIQEGAPETLEKFRQAGITVWMLTGDRPDTATNVAIAVLTLYIFYKNVLLVLPQFIFGTSGKLLWDSTIMLIVLYSAIVVPIEVGFPDIPFTAALQAIGVIIDVLFLLDVLQNFFVGYYVNEEDTLITDRSLIAKRYLMTWFVPDVISSLPTEYIFSGLGDGGHDKSVASLKLARVIRLVRVTKLTRLIKLRQFARKIEDVLEVDAVVARLSQVIGQVLLVTHVLACFWHLVGYTDDDTSETWINTADLHHVRPGERYVYSFYWVVSTLAGVGYGDVHATNTEERLFAMATQIVGACGFGIIIGNITKILENWNREAMSRVRKLSIVQEFVTKKSMPKQLKQNLLRYFRHYIARTSAFDERELLCEFSLSLRGEILGEAYRNTFFQIPAFQQLSPQFVMDMAMYIKPLIAVKGDILARERSVGTEMFILNHGVVEVKRTANNGDWIIVLEILTERGIFGEASLLNYTLHHNSYTAKDNCDLYTLPKEDFDRLLEEFPEVEQALTLYHQERSNLHDRVFEQTLARYRVFMNSRNNDPVSELTGIENIYPTLTVLLDGVLQSYRSVPLHILEKMTLEISMGVSVFNSVHEKKKMIGLLSRHDDFGPWHKLQTILAKPISPDAPWRMRWNIFIGIILAYCAVAIPYEVSFLADRTDGSVFSNVMEVFIGGSFVVDMILNFRTAFHDRPDHIVTGDREIAVAYLRSWFIIDLISIIPASTIISSIVRSSNESRTIYLLRVVRLLKLSRLLKLLRTVLRVETLATAQHSTTRVFRLALKVLFIAHLLGCGYYFVASAARESFEKSVLNMVPSDYSLIQTYVFCVYWAMTTMTTVGYGDTPPGNTLEVAALSDNLRSQVVLYLNRDVVSKIAFFASQDDMCVSYLMGILDPEFCTPGEYVFKEGQVGRHMYFLVKGVAEILFHADTPQEVVVATLLEGSYFGEIAMLTMSKRAASIRAKTYISLFVLSRSGLDRISLHYPDMAHNILQEFKKKITHIKQTSLRHLGPLIQEDVRSAKKADVTAGTHSELQETLGELEDIVGQIVTIFGGGDKGKRKALACVMQHLRKYEFSLDDFLHAAEEFSTFSESTSSARERGSVPKITYSAMIINKLQQKMRRRSSFS